MRKLLYPLIAVAASNDYVSGGVAVTRTADGGRTWHTTRITPQFVGTRDFCNGSGLWTGRRQGRS